MNLQMKWSRIYKYRCCCIVINLVVEMKNIELRRAKLGDEKILAYIQTESWKAAFSGILSLEELERCTDLEKAEEMYRNVLSRDLVNLVIEYVDKDPHCIAGWSQNRSDLGTNVAELICIHSLCDQWHKGYGSIMMNYILDEIKEKGYSEVILWVFEKNRNARSFYEKHGFELTSLKNQSHGAIEIMYSKQL